MPQPLRPWPPEGVVPNGGINQAVQRSHLKDHEWSDGLDVEPFPKGVRRRKGLSFSSDLLAADLETENATGISKNAWSTTRTKIAQSFPITTAKVFKVVVKIDPDLSLGVGALHCSIFTDVASQPSAAVSGYGEANFNSISLAGLSGVQFVTFVSDLTGAAINGTHWIHIRQQGLPGSGTAAWLYNTGSDTYASHEMLWDDGAGWVNTSTPDGVFQVFTEPTEKEITAIFDFLKDDGTQRHLVQFTQTLYKLVGTTLTSLGTLDTDHGKDVLPAIAQLQERVFITNGITGDPSKKFYIFGGAEKFENEGILAPTSAGSIAKGAGGSLADGTYYVDYAYWNDDIKVQSNTRYDGIIANALTAATSAADNQLDITGLPGAVARTGDRATHIRLYIFGPGTNNKWVYAGDSGGQITIGTTLTTISNPTNFSSEAEFDHNLPPVHTIKLATSKRQFIAGVENEPNRVYWSRKEGTDFDPESFPAFNFREVGVNDTITALFLVSPNIVIVGCKNSIWALDAENPGQVDETLLADGVGIAGHKSGTVVGTSLLFISDAKKNKGPHVWDGQSVRPLVKLDEFYKGLNDTRANLISCAHLAPGDTRFQWWTLVTQSGSTDHDRIVVYDYNLDAFTIYSITGNVLGEVEVSGSSKLFIGGLEGQELQADSGSSDLGSQIPAEFTGPDITMGQLAFRKKLRGIVHTLNEMAEGGLSLDVEQDLGEAKTLSAALNVASATGNVLGTGTFGTFVLAAGERVVRRSPLCGSARTFGLRFFSSADWVLENYSLQYQFMRRK